MNAIANFAEFSLDSLLTESMAEVAVAKKAKENRTRLAIGNLHPEAKAALLLEVREHELKVDWIVKAAVAVFNRQFCASCECVHIQFEGFFQRQLHRSSKAERWVKSNKQSMLPTLPKEVKYEESETETCEECCGLEGYPIEE